MEKSIFDVMRRKAEAHEIHRGHVTISITEGLGAYWLMPRLVEFQREHLL